MTLPDILDKLGVEYSPSNKSGEYLIRCIDPSHADNNPSMHINEDVPYPFYCFSCGCKGSLIADCKQYFGKSYFDIDKDASSKKVEWTKGKKFEKKKGNLDIKYEGDIYPVWSIAEAFQYVQSRGILDNFIRDFGCFVVRKWKLSYWVEGKKEEKYWYNRLIIPICDKDGNVISYEGRDFTRKSKAKVLYPPASENQDHLFNLENVDLSKPVIIVEGVMGLSSVWNVDKNVVAVMGKILSPMQKKIISSIPEIIVIPDNDWNKGKDNLLDTLRVYDEFYPREYKLAIIDQEGADTNDLNRRQIKHLLTNKLILSIDAWMKYYDARKEYNWNM